MIIRSIQLFGPMPVGSQDDRRLVAAHCDQTVHCLLGILPGTVQMTELYWERMDGEKTHLNSRDRWRPCPTACPIFSQDHQ